MCRMNLQLSGSKRTTGSHRLMMVTLRTLQLVSLVKHNTESTRLDWLAMKRKRGQGFVRNQRSAHPGPHCDVLNGFFIPSYICRIVDYAFGVRRLISLTQGGPETSLGGCFFHQLDKLVTQRWQPCTDEVPLKSNFKSGLCWISSQCCF